MRKLIFFAVVLAAMPSLAAAGEGMLCLKNVTVNVTNLTSDAPIRIADSTKRKDKISLKINVDCKSGAILVPNTISEAKDWLDLALPYDFKSALTAGTTFNPYVYTSYGYSAEYDLYNYFNKAWNLTPDSAICKALPKDEDEKKGVNWCFYNLIDSMRNDYKHPKVTLPIAPSNE